MIGRVLTEVPEGFHIGLLLRDGGGGSLSAWIAATADLDMSLDQVVDLLEGALGRCRESMRVDSTIEQMEQGL